MRPRRRREGRKVELALAFAIGLAFGLAAALAFVSFLWTLAGAPTP